MNKLKYLIIILFCSFILVSCDGEITTEDSAVVVKEEISYKMQFYDNHGTLWLNAKGKQFDIIPNKVKEYYYSSDGTWTSGYTLSSMITYEIDGYQLHSTGSTVIIADNRLEFTTDLPDIKSTISEAETELNTPLDLSVSEYIDLGLWWKSKNLNNKQKKSSLVIIQSQQGDMIAIYYGKKVSWDIPKNLPKTTEIIIDGKSLFVHRANLAIVDTGLFNLD